MRRARRVNVTSSVSARHEGAFGYSRQNFAMPCHDDIAPGVVTISM